MSSAIDFAVRTAAGGTTYGHVAGPGDSSFIQAGLGDSLSLNLTPQSVIGYSRQGNDLLIELSDGRTITVADWFDAPGDTPNRLYLSSDGMVTEVQLSDTGNGMLAANFSLAAGMRSGARLTICASMTGIRWSLSPERAKKTLPAWAFSPPRFWAGAGPGWPGPRSSSLQES